MEMHRCPDTALLPLDDAQLIGLSAGLVLLHIGGSKERRAVSFCRGSCLIKADDCAVDGDRFRGSLPKIWAALE